LLLRLGARLGGERPARVRAPDDRHEPAPARPLPRDRRPVEPAGVLEGVRLQGRRRDGAQGGVPNLVGTRALSRAALAATLLAADLLAASGDKGQPGKVRIVYRDSEIDPANRPAVAVLRKSRVFERFADWINGSVALPYDLNVNVTDRLPPGVDDPVTEP